jgi:hypothetical protein
MWPYMLLLVEETLEEEKCFISIYILYLSPRALSSRSLFSHRYRHPLTNQSPITNHHRSSIPGTLQPRSRAGKSPHLIRTYVEHQETKVETPSHGMLHTVFARESEMREPAGNLLERQRQRHSPSSSTFCITGKNLFYYKIRDTCLPSKVHDSKTPAECDLRRVQPTTREHRQRINLRNYIRRKFRGTGIRVTSSERKQAITLPDKFHHQLK